MNNVLRAGGIWYSGGLILLESSADHDVWGLPGGGIEEGESAAQACLREFREELGVEVGCERLALVIENFWREGNALKREYGFYFVVFPVQPMDSRPILTSLEPQIKFAWFPLKTLPSLTFVPEFLKTILPELPDETLFISHHE